MLEDTIIAFPFTFEHAGGRFCLFVFLDYTQRLCALVVIPLTLSVGREPPCSGTLPGFCDREEDYNRGSCSSPGVFIGVLAEGRCRGTDVINVP